MPAFIRLLFDFWDRRWLLFQDASNRQTDLLRDEIVLLQEQIAIEREERLALQCLLFERFGIITAEDHRKADEQEASSKPISRHSEPWPRRKARLEQEHVMKTAANTEADRLEKLWKDKVRTGDAS